MQYYVRVRSFLPKSTGNKSLPWCSLDPRIILLQNNDVAEIERTCSIIASDEHPLFDVTWFYEAVFVCLIVQARHDTRSCSAAVPMCWPVQSLRYVVTWSSKSLKTKCTVEVLCYCILLEMLDNPGFIFNANVKPRIIRIWSSLTALLPWHIRNCITRGILLIAGGRVTCTLLPEEQSTLSICSWMLRCCQLVVHWQVSLRMKNRGHGF